MVYRFVYTTVQQVHLPYWLQSQREKMTRKWVLVFQTLIKKVFSLCYLCCLRSEAQGQHINTTIAKSCAFCHNLYYWTTNTCCNNYFYFLRWQRIIFFLFVIVVYCFSLYFYSYDFFHLEDVVRSEEGVKLIFPEWPFQFFLIVRNNVGR